MKLKSLSPENVFRYFEEISAIPRGSGYMEKISGYCLEFAKKYNLKAIRDEYNNVVIYKNGTEGCENAEPVILQGHLDMVWQKKADCGIDFYNDGLDLYVEGDFLKARGTTLGADDGIAVAMILAILSSDEISHPPVEAVFTTDEETGMFGALGFSTELVKGKRMINIDSEDADKVTVSCAGGFEFRSSLPIKKEKCEGKKLTISLGGLKGGHSGVEIDKNRVNADLLIGRIAEFSLREGLRIIKLNGGDKGNVIPSEAALELVCFDDSAENSIRNYLEVIKAEISDREEGFEYNIALTPEKEELSVIDEASVKSIIGLLFSAPNGVFEMSTAIVGLVESSGNLGIIKTNENAIEFVYTFRSNKSTVLEFVEKKMSYISDMYGFSFEACGHYPPWEYNSSSEMEKLYISCSEEIRGVTPEVCAIHAGLECGIFAGKIKDFDCISIGPDAHDIHTVNERLSISSTEEIYKVLVTMLKKLAGA